ncbi:MAG: ATP-NAD kinase [Dethiosulfovibrio peptidovorans]|nr:MAG: ATP-NAD kinase [Dethiosulfovibrio peptidovorans]
MSLSSRHTTLGMIVNTQKKRAADLAQRLLRWAPAQGINFRLPPQDSSALDVEPCLGPWTDGLSVALVIGGDGTFLRAARYILEEEIALYGINVGRLGFLAAGDPENAERDVLQIVQGDFHRGQRSLLFGEIVRDGKSVQTMYALNDLVLTKGPLARVMEVEILVSGSLACVLRSDGIIASTPTGSTAYSLSAGGPIVPPHVPCMIMAPICAHTLYARPMVLGPRDVLRLHPKGEGITLTQDGQLGYELFPGDYIDIRLSFDKNLETLWLPDRSYYDLLRAKLMWGHSGLEDSV